LHPPRPEPVDIVQRSAELSAELIAVIESRLSAGKPEVQSRILLALHDWLSGRIVASAEDQPRASAS
jgi:hypothetical protein